MMIQQAKELLKTYDFRSQLKQGQYIDAKDSVDKWCVAQIQKVVGEIIYLHYEGWGVKYDIEQRRTSAKLQPFRRQVFGYSGQSKNAIRSFTLNQQTLKQMSEKVQNLIYTNLQGLGAHETTQFLRGKLYFFIDMMLSHADLKVQHVPMILKFHDLYFSLVKKWAQLYKKSIPLIKENKETHNLYLVHEATAIAVSYPELIENLNKLFSGSRFQRKLADLSNHAKVDIKKKLQESCFDSNCISQLFKILEYKDEKGRLACPFELAYQILILARNITISKVENPHANQIIAIMTERIQQINNIQIKQIEKRKVKDVLDILCNIRQYSTKQSKEVIERQRDHQELKLAVKFLRSPYLQKKIHGLNDLKQFSKRGSQGNRVSRGLSQKQFCDWLLEEGIIPQIFGESCHVQLVKRSTALLKQLLIQKKLPEEYIEILWGCTMGKHQDTVRMTYQVIVDIAEDLGLTLSAKLFESIKQIKPIDYDVIKLNFLHDFTIKIKKMISKYERTSSYGGGYKIQGGYSNKIDSTLYYNPKIFWEIMDVHHDPEIKSHACYNFCQIIPNESTEIKSLFLDLSVQNLKEHKNFIYSLEIIISILDGSVIKQKKVFIENLKLSPNDLIKIVLKNLKIYMQRVRQFLKQPEGLKIDKNSIHRNQFEPKNRHSMVIQTIKNALLQIIMINNNVEFKNDEIQQIWNLTIANPICDHDSFLFIKFLMEQITNNKSGQYRNYILTDPNFKHLLLEIIPKSLNYKRVNLDIANNLKNLFYMVNKKQKNITRTNNNQQYFQGKPSEYYGYDMLWQCLLHSQHNNTFQSLSKFMTDMLTKNKNPPQTKANIQVYLGNCCQAILKQINARDEGQIIQSYQINEMNKLLLRLVRLLKYIVIRIEGIIFAKEPQYFNPDYETDLKLWIKVNGDYKPLICKINTQAHCVVHLRKMVFDRIKHLGVKGYNDFTIYADKVNLEMKFDDTSLSQLEHFRNWEILYKQSPFNDADLPRFILANNMDCLNCLFRLFTVNDIDVINETWELISLMPPNAKIKDKLSSLNISKNTPIKQWENFLDINKNSKLLAYYLTILSQMVYTKQVHQQVININRYQKKNINMLMNLQQIESISKNLPKFQEKVKYTKQFIVKGGYEYVKHQLINGKWLENNSHNMIDVKIVVLLLKILTTPLIHSIDRQSMQTSSIIKNIFNTLSVISRSDFTSESQSSSPQISQQQEQNKKKSNEQEKEQEESSKANIKSVDVLDDQNIKESGSQEYNIYDYCQVIKFGFTLIKQLILGSKESRHEIEDQCQKCTSKILIIMVLKHKNKQIREASIDAFYDLAESVSDFSGVMIQSLLGSYQQAYDIGQECDQYFILTQRLMEMNMNKTTQLLSRGDNQLINQMWKKCQERIIHRSILETKSSDKDIFLVGTLKLARILLECMQNAPDGLKILHSHLLRNRLFQPFMNDNVFQEKQNELFKNSSTRRAALRLLMTASRLQPNLSHICLKHLLPFHTQDSWRKWANSDWNIICDHKQKSDTGYVGLRNMGSTCYMNSLLQQLFMIPAFRKMILQVDAPMLPPVEGHEQPQIDEENVIWQLKKVFGSLLMSDEQYYDPSHFVHSFKDIDGSPINPQEQRDVDEFFNMLMERVEMNLKGTPQYQEYLNTFGGNLSNELICFDCPHRSEREQPFLAMPLAVMNKKSLKESLDQYVRGDMLEGENAYHCQKCDKKVSTLKRCSTKRLPNNLLLVLKRFHFNFETMEKYKLNHYLEFPRQLDMKDYSQEHLSKRDLLNKLGIAQEIKGENEEQKQENQSKANDVQLNEDQMRILQKCYPDEYYKYKLKGIVVHYGQADHGHYFSFISDRKNNSENETWIQFNDKIVTYFNPKLISTAYGGYNSSTNRQSLQNAYILLYERVELIDTQQLERDMQQLMGQEINLNEDWKIAQNRIKTQLKQKMKRLEPAQNDANTNMMMMMMAKNNSQSLSNSGSNIIANGSNFVQRKGIKTPKIIHEMVNQANHRFWLSQNIFNQDYIQFLTHLYDDLFKQYQKPVSLDDARSMQFQNLEPPLPQYEVTRFGLTVFLTTIVRYKHKRDVVISFVKLLKKALTRDMAACFWIIETFSFDAIIRQILLECPIMEVTHHIGGLIRLAMHMIYQIEKDVIQKICSECFVNGSLDYNRFGELFGLNIIAPEKETISKTEEQEKKKQEAQNPPPQKEKTDRGEKPKSSNIPKYYPQALLKHQSKCPYLITFINALLHQIFPNLKKSDSFAYFYKIFSDFIELGPQAKLYLLSCRTLNVFASIIQFADKASIYAPECLRDIIQIVQPPDLKISLGFGKIIPDDKHIYRSVQGSQKSLSYMLQTLSKLIKSCVFKEHIDNQKEKSTSLNVQAPCFKLSEAQCNQLAKCLIDNRNKILQNSNCRIAQRAIGQIYSHITFNNQIRTQDIINAIFGFIERDPQIYVQRFFDILMIVSRVKDDLRLLRIQFVLSHLFEQLKKFRGFLYFSFILQNFFILLAKKEHLLVKKGIQSNQKLAGALLQQFKKFFEDNKNIQFNYKIHFFKKLNFDQGYFHEYLTEDFHNKLSYYFRDAFDKIKRIFNGNEIKTENSYYLYDIQQVENFENVQKGSYVDFLVYYEWNNMKVEENTGEFMKLSFVDQSSTMIYFTQTDNDCLAQDKTMSKANIPDQYFAQLYNGVYEHNAKLAAQAASRS